VDQSSRALVTASVETCLCCRMGIFAPPATVSEMRGEQGTGRHLAAPKAVDCACGDEQVRGDGRAETGFHFGAVADCRPHTPAHPLSAPRRVAPRFCFEQTRRTDHGVWSAQAKSECVPLGPSAIALPGVRCGRAKRQGNAPECASNPYRPRT
jgi:hypothetical protein